MTEGELIHIRRLDIGTPLYREASALCSWPGADAVGLLPRLGVRTAHSGSNRWCERSICICAMADEEPEAVLFLDRAGDSLQVRQLAVLPRLNSRAAAEQMIYFAEQVALTEAVGRMVLEAVALARPFYERQGYRVCSTRRVGQGEVLLMEKDLLEGLRVQFPPRG